MNLPQEFLTRMEAMLGDEFPLFVHSYEEPRQYALRVNTLKISPEEFLEIAPFHLSPVPWTDNGFYYEKEDCPSRHPFYYAGLYYLQEPSAMAPAQFLPVCPGERVLDLCAAPGGKATALAAKLQGKGLLVANDISASRAKALLKNLELFGVVNAFVTNTAPAHLAGQFKESFDKILVDAPCSGEGMFRKDVSNAKLWSLNKVRDCAKVQKEIIRQAAAMLRPGGMMLYSTCTFAPEENEQVIAWLLDCCPQMELIPIPKTQGFCSGRPDLADPDWDKNWNRNWNKNGKTEVEEGTAVLPAEGQSTREAKNRQTLSYCMRAFPHRAAGEGHFLALLRKQEGKPAADTMHACGRPVPLRDGSAAIKRRRKNEPEKPGGRDHSSDRESITAFFKDILTEEAMHRVGKEKSGRAAGSSSGLEIYNGEVYFVSESPNVAGGIRFLRNGLYLGEIRKNRFEPSQALAMALKSSDCSAVLNLSSGDDRVRRYLCGETIDVRDLAGEDLPGSADSSADMPQKRKEKSCRRNGWQLVCADHYPLGWGKLTDGVLKNKYHAGWRMQQ